MGALKLAKLAVEFALVKSDNLKLASDVANEAFEATESARASCALETRARPEVVARRVRVAWRVSRAATLFLTEGRTEERRAAEEEMGGGGMAEEAAAADEEEEEEGVAPCKSAIERVARRAGEGVLTTLRGEAGAGMVGDIAGRVRTVAKTGETRGEAMEGDRDGGRATFAGYGREPSSTDEATLRRERVEGDLRMMPGVRRREVAEGCLVKPTAAGAAEGGVGRGRAVRTGGGGKSVSRSSGNST